MEITSIEECPGYSNRKKISPKRKYKVYIDYNYGFPLYYQDIVSLQLEVGTPFNQSIYDRILEDLVLPRAKQKAMDLLKMQDRSVHELCSKLKDQYYPDSIIDETLRYINRYGYLDDERFATNYIKNRMDHKSKRILQQELLQKGVDGDLIEQVLQAVYEESELDPEYQLILKHLKRLVKGSEELSWDDKQKILAKMYRKGFEPDKVRELLKQLVAKE